MPHNILHIILLHTAMYVFVSTRSHTWPEILKHIFGCVNIRAVELLPQVISWVDLGFAERNN